MIGEEDLREVLGTGQYDVQRFEEWLEQHSFERGLPTRGGWWHWQSPEACIKYRIRSGWISDCEYAQGGRDFFPVVSRGRLSRLWLSEPRPTVPPDILAAIEGDHSLQAIPERVIWVAAQIAQENPRNVSLDTPLENLFDDDDVSRETFFLKCLTN
jgi:hypothetical protein